MPASPRREPAPAVPSTAGAPAAPQHHDLFLQPRYTVELPPLEDEDDVSEPAPSFPARRRRETTRGR
ncbi:hypothetical protein ACFVYF_09930 [Streptomyces sp. NPDC058274]|uniref:hypothetical protein n=1 Tax=Streptomyces sp. NPDC058274 TaxID=3346416 RepID=UPI0036E8C1FA